MWKYDLMTNRYHQYRVMWLFVFFDLPTNSKAETKAANFFRKVLLKDGFTMFQFSIYLRHCSSRENAKVHESRVKKALPKYGKVGILSVTDKQFGMMEIFHGRKEIKSPSPVQQLEMF